MDCKPPLPPVNSCFKDIIHLYPFIFNLFLKFNLIELVLHYNNYLSLSQSLLLVIFFSNFFEDHKGFLPPNSLLD